MTYAEYEPDPYVQPFNRSIEAYIVDLDGTIAGRDHDDPTTRGPHDYDRVYEDYPIHEVITPIRALQNAGYEIIFVSGRPESCRRDTSLWIPARAGLHLDTLHMRTTGDRRPDTIVKRELFDKYIRPRRLRIGGVFDDRNRVVFKTWREQLGLTVFHVAWHDF
jgi:hypothetical protein